MIKSPYCAVDKKLAFVAYSRAFAVVAGCGSASLCLPMRAASALSGRWLLARCWVMQQWVQWWYLRCANSVQRHIRLSRPGANCRSPHSFAQRARRSRQGSLIAPAASWEFAMPCNHLLDMMWTMTNVTGDATVSVAVERMAGEIDVEEYRSADDI